ncbi:reverse transcriptase domain, reverse transcriptase zinc-binding domain protein [Tanacetum coccineum]
MDSITTRAINYAGLNMNTKVAEVISDYAWSWPTEWATRYPHLFSLTILDLNVNEVDQVVWRNRTGIKNMFYVGRAWDDIRPRGNDIAWTYVVWFTHCIPRHTFHLWLVIQRKLKTQDHLRQWDVSPSSDLNLSKCPLCDLIPYSHNHLFFECPFASQVWSNVKLKARIQNM